MSQKKLRVKGEDVVRFLEAAREVTEDRYREPEYSYVCKALCVVFDNCTEWLDYGAEAGMILLEALQDERAILNRHNRIRAKDHFQRKKAQSIPEELVNFPLRFMCLKNGDVKLPIDFFGPIYQVEDDLPTSTTSSSERSASNAGHRVGKLWDAPSPTHDFPDGNFTLAEIAAFLPQSIKSWDVADRIIWNGAASEDLAIMFNQHRGLSPNIDINSVYLMFRGQMRKRTKAEHGYTYWKTWRVTAQADVQKPINFDPESISVTGFRRPIIFRNRPNVPANPIPFKDLANGVAEWPEGYDALDLTRCVFWCAEHPEVDYYYPTDYQTVLYERVGGPLPPDARHSDAQSLARLRSGTGRNAPRRRTTSNRSDDGIESAEEDDDLRLGQRKRGNSASEEHGKRGKCTTTGPARQLRTTRSTVARPSDKKRASLETESDADTDDDAYQDPKRTKKNKDGPRRSGRIKTRTVSYAHDAMDTGEADDALNEMEEAEDHEFGEVEGDGDKHDEGADEMDVDE